MPERVVGFVAQFYSDVRDALLFAAIGIILGWAQSKAQREKDTGVVIGRSICVGGMAMAAGTVLIWVPQLPIVGQIGVAALLASLGTSGLERMLLRIIEAKTGGVGQ